MQPLNWAELSRATTNLGTALIVSRVHEQEVKDLSDCPFLTCLHMQTCQERTIRQILDFLLVNPRWVRINRCMGHRWQHLEDAVVIIVISFIGLTLQQSTITVTVDKLQTRSHNGRGDGDVVVSWLKWYLWCCRQTFNHSGVIRSNCVPHLGLRRTRKWTHRLSVCTQTTDRSSWEEKCVCWRVLTGKFVHTQYTGSDALYPQDAIDQPIVDPDCAALQCFSLYWPFKMPLQFSNRSCLHNYLRASNWPPLYRVDGKGTAVIDDSINIFLMIYNFEVFLQFQSFKCYSMLLLFAATALHYLG